MERIRHHRLAETLGARDGQHFRREICAGDYGVGQTPGDRQGEIAASSGEIENPSRPPARDPSCRTVAPQKIRAAAEQMIREIVSPSDAPKHCANNFWITRR